MSQLSENQLKERIDSFRMEIPYKQLPYSKRSWGHELHSLCSYQGKLKPSIAYWLINQFTLPGDIVLDPTGGTGTIPFEACLQGRQGITNDLSPFAAVVGAAKVAPPSKSDAMAFFELFSKEYEKISLTEEDYVQAEFGLNASIRDYFHPDTLIEILKARKWFICNDSFEPAQNYIKANILHILHGNRPYALSRTSHPITPFSPKGEFEYKSLLNKLETRLLRMLDVPFPEEHIQGKYYASNFSLLPNLLEEKVDAIITSPPFVGMRFDRPNWMRMWFSGWNANDFHTKSKLFLERQQSKNWDIYNEYFEMCHTVLRDNGLIIMHIGGSTKYNMVDKLIERSSNLFKYIDIVTEDVTDTQNHGIKDKGTTSSHNYLFLVKT